MRPLTEEETRLVLEKLTKFLQSNVRLLVARTDERHCFRLQRERVYYCSESNMKTALHVGRDQLACVGTCIGKFTKSRQFRLQITCLDYLAQYARYKVWIKPNAEMSFLYGNHVPKAAIGRMTENTPQYAGVVVYSMGNVPLGFGAAAQSTEQCRQLDPGVNVVLHQADVGEYLRSESDLG